MIVGLTAWFYPTGDHNHGCVEPDSEFELYFGRDDQPGHSLVD